MLLYNTLTRKHEEFKPIEQGKIRFYHCGPTVYWVQHIGNLRAMTWADLIRRSLTFLGYKVTFVRNYTDVGHLVSDQDEGEDKMEKGARREGLTPSQIADKYIKIFNEDTQKLNIIPPDHAPRATEFIQQMIEMIQVLLKKKHAYITEYAVYFDISTFKNYNELNRQKIDLNIAGAGKGKIEDPGKKHFSDFALWFFKKGAHKNALQTWPSPWGEGFPGWHIECSVMAKSLLGETIDIHMGGVEHIAVHHTNEIAQSESANGIAFVNYWLHNEHLNVESEKMAKSAGTSFTLSDIIKKGYDPLDLRYFYLNAHYRSKQNFTWESLSGA
ncbi:cysteine--tRNA ligase, partial [Candidatus Roizmanbacteria bacterium]|nr:cysteine--tRNA ligase [Candidatus Roizmanbacteria bacterium]